jgi:hypothetical protein
MTNETCKASACQFAADIEIRERKSDTDRSTPVRLVARSGNSLSHWYWGECVHDLEGMQHKPSIPLDFNHDVSDIVGYANRFNTESGDLEISGALTPYGDSDTATMIAAKAEMGVPWEASINFAGDMEIERIPEGQPANVNGREFTGPLTVFRSWTLRGCAITPYGYDPATSTEFAGDPEISISIREPETMAESMITNIPEQTENLSAETDQAVIDAPEVSNTTEAEPELQTSNDGSAVEVDEDRAVLGGRFMAAFGSEMGAIYFAQGMSWQDAVAAHLAFQSERILTLEHQLSAAQGGEPEAASFTPTETQKKREGLITRIPK